MNRDLGRRFWWEVTAIGLSAALLGLTLAWPRWIELVLGVDPDGGSGLLEWSLLLVCSTTLIGTSALARRDWRRCLETLAPSQPGPTAER